MRKKVNTLLLGLLIACMCLCLGSCGKPSQKRSMLAKEWMLSTDKLKVLSTTAMVDDLVGKIGGDKVMHMPLIQGNLDPHSYELVKGDHEKIQSADVVFFNGLDLEHGASLKFLLENSDKSVSLGNHLKVVAREKLIDVDTHIDPHVWMDVSLFSQCIDPIVEELSRKDPEHAMEFRKRGDALREAMLTLDQDIYQMLQSIPENNRYLIASHDAFFYFTRRYLANPHETEMSEWKQRFSAPEGLAPDGQISTQDIQKIINHALKHHILVVFPESNVNRDGVKKIVGVLNKKGLNTRLATECLYGDAMGEQGSGAESYLEMMLHNAKTISKYLEQGKADAL